MDKPFVRLALLAGSFWFAPWAWGAVSGIYPGLSNMVGNSQAVVVVSIQSSPKTLRTNSSNVWAVQRVKVLYVLKGRFREQDEVDVALSPFLLFPTYPQVGEFPIDERYVLFIANDSLPPQRYAIVNAEWSAFWIPREADLAILEPGDIRSNVEALLNLVSENANLRKRDLEDSIQQFLSDEPRR